MRVVFFGTYDESRHPRVRVLHEGLQQHGFSTSVLNEPLRDSTSERLEAAQSPVFAFKWIIRLSMAWVRLMRTSIRFRPVDVVVVGYLGVFDVLLARIRWPRACIVLDHMAPMRGIASDRSLGPLATGVLGALDRLAEAAATLVVFDTVEHADQSTKSPERRLVVPVGATREWFDHRRERAAGECLEVVFYGLFTPLQGAPVVAAAMHHLRGVNVHLTMIGSGQDLEAARAAAPRDASITWIPWVDAVDLPRLVADQDVCLGVFGRTPKSYRVVPNKVYQGAAAGCAIVTADTEPQRRALGDAAVLVPAGDAEALGTALADLASNPDELSRRRIQAAQAALAWTPQAVTATLATRLRAVAHRRR